MGSKYIKFRYEDLLTGKKQLLASEINLLKTLGKIRDYKLLREQELELKDKIRARLKNARGKIELIETYFPEDIKVQEKKRTKLVKEKNKNRDKDIEENLKEIKKKLELLG